MSKKKLLKILISITIIITLFTVTNIAGFAGSKQSKLSRDTVITKKNINRIFKHYGLDPKLLKKSNSTSEKAALTVGQLEDAINILKKQSKEAKLNENKTIVNEPLDLKNKTNTTMVTGPMAYSSSNTGTKRLKNVVDYTTYKLNHNVDARYMSGGGVKIYTGTSNPHVTIKTQNAPGTVNKLTKVYYVRASHTSSRVTLEDKVKVSFYLIVGVPGYNYLYYMSSNDITTTSIFGTSHIPY